MFEELVARVRYHIRKANFMGLKEIESTLLLGESADAIEELQEDNAALNGTVSNLIQQIEELNKPRWIPVRERLPERNAVDERGFAKAYLVKTDRHVMMHTARWDGMYWILWGKSTTLTDKVTHWMPLPEPPKEEAT